MFYVRFNFFDSKHNANAKKSVKVLFLFITLLHFSNAIFVQ